MVTLCGNQNVWFSIWTLTKHWYHILSTVPVDDIERYTDNFMGCINRIYSFNNRVTSSYRDNNLRKGLLTNHRICNISSWLWPLQHYIKNEPGDRLNTKMPSYPYFDSNRKIRFILMIGPPYIGKDVYVTKRSPWFSGYYYHYGCSMFCFQCARSPGPRCCMSPGWMYIITREAITPK